MAFPSWSWQGAVDSESYHAGRQGNRHQPPRTQMPGEARPGRRAQANTTAMMKTRIRAAQTAISRGPLLSRALGGWLWPSTPNTPLQTALRSPSGLWLPRGDGACDFERCFSNATAMPMARNVRNVGEI